MFIIFLSLFLIASTEDIADPGSDEGLSRSNTYRYFNFVRQWSPNGCYHADSRHHCKTQDPSETFWTIHGLWPAYSGSSYPSYCKTCHFDKYAFNKVINTMHKRWPTDYSGGDTGFWSHEYCKHGTCCQDVFPTELSYFSAALKLNQRLDIDKALSSARIVPSTTRHYSFYEVQKAIKNAFGVNEATYWCRFSDGKQLLFQISICVDKSLKTMNCPKGGRVSCRSSQPIYFLPFSALHSEFFAKIRVSDKHGETRRNSETRK